mgnify:CR=1 FL=1
MTDIIFTQITKTELISELRTEILSGISELLNESREKDLELKEWLTAKEVEKLLKISSVTRWNWTNSGILKSHKIGNRLRYRKDDVLKALLRKEPKI